MSKGLRWKWSLIFVVMIVCVLGITGIPKTSEDLLTGWKKNIRLGLDLKGGSQIVMQIQVQDAFKAEADRVIDRLKETMAKETVAYASIERNEPTSLETADTVEIQVKGVPADKTADFRRLITEAVGTEWFLTPLNSTDYKLNIRKEAAIRLHQDTVTQTISTLHKKVDGLGVAEASVQQRGGSSGEAEVLISLPGVDDPARVKSILQTTAMLELCEVKDGPFSSREEVLAKHGGVLPINSKIIRGSRRAGDGQSENWWLLGRSPVVTGRDLRDARPQQGQMAGTWETSFTLAQDAASRFARFTEQNVGNRLAIVLDNVVLSAPRIESRISDQGRITGAATQEEASDLALNLRAGSLPASVKVLEERTVGPSLGADSIRQGVTAGLVGLFLVVLSMLFYYHGAGVNAVLALILNTIITIAALVYIDATWTLPGIAGLVLSIGMAVDSNVLIFERIKEEQKAGKSVVNAIAAGFDRALVTIIDTHVTTVVASAFLFIFGTGPVRGFAVTLVIGLVANLFTAVFVSRSIFDMQVVRNPRLSKISIGSEGMQLFANSNIDFLSKRNLALGLSVLAMVASIGSIVMKGGLKYGLDFRGGTLMYVKFAPVPKIDQLRDLLSSKLKGEISVQETQGTGEFIIGTELADEGSLDKTRQTVEATLHERYGVKDGKLDLNSTNQLALESMLRNTLPSASVSLNDEQVTALATRILAYRDKVKSGLVGNLDELKNVEGVNDAVLGVVKQNVGLGSFNLRSVEIVGPRAGKQLREQALLATLCALGGMLVYIAFRFKLISGAAAVIATVHDVVITLGLFSVFNREINLNIIAALLTLIGYSMNDKIVVFDRVRENQNSKRRGGSFHDLVNQSINQTLSRTLLTAGPTLLACLALYFLGGEVLNGIAFALFVGIVVGTYSSIFVASALLVMYEERREAAYSAKASAAPATAKR